VPRPDKPQRNRAVSLIPQEFNIGGVYLSPLLIAGILGCVAAWLTAHLLNRHRLSRFFYFPPPVFVTLVVIYTVILGTFVIPS